MGIFIFLGVVFAIVVIIATLAGIVAYQDGRADASRKVGIWYRNTWVRPFSSLYDLGYYNNATGKTLEEKNKQAYIERFGGTK